MSYYSKLKHVLILGDASEFNDVTTQLVICVVKHRKQEVLYSLNKLENTKTLNERFPSRNALIDQGRRRTVSSHIQRWYKTSGVVEKKRHQYHSLTVLRFVQQ
jgi:uncharacterized protein YbbC (DUF1343 family)